MSLRIEFNPLFLDLTLDLYLRQTCGAFEFDSTVGQHRIVNGKPRSTPARDTEGV